MARRDVEGPIHRSILHWLRLVLPGALIHHSANEINISGDRVMREIGKAKALGMAKGWPDIEVLTADGPLFLEVKAPGREPSEDQSAIHAKMRRLGYRVAVVRGIEDVRAALAEWGVKTREARA